MSSNEKPDFADGLLIAIDDHVFKHIRLADRYIVVIAEQRGEGGRATRKIVLLCDGVAVFLLLKAFDVERHRAAADPDVDIERTRLGREAAAPARIAIPVSAAATAKAAAMIVLSSRVPLLKRRVRVAQWTVILIVVVTCMTELLPKFCNTEVMPALLLIE